jgi:hypothetical protein
VNFTVLVIFSCFAFGMGYTVGQAQRFGFFKFLIVFVFSVPLLMQGNDYHTIGVIFAFLSGFLVSRGVISLDLWDEIIYRANIFKQFFTKIKEKQDQRKQEDQKENTEKDNNYEQRVNKEKERRREEAKQRREQDKKQESKQREEQKQTHNERVEKKDYRTFEEILGLSNNFTKAGLKKAYRSACSRYHPDKYTHLSEALQEEMSIEFKKVQEAYKVLGRKF